MNKAQVLVAIQMVLFAIFVMGLIVLERNTNTILLLAGGLLSLLGAMIGLQAIRQHPGGPNISPSPRQSGGLVTSGPYRWVRHPIYTGVIFGAFGLALMHGHIALLGMGLVFVIFFTYKSSYEESLLLRVFSDYEQYRRSTGRFLPPIRTS